MFATISLNGHFLGNVSSQFVRTHYDVSDLLAADGANTLNVTFHWGVNVNGRFMACTGGWDWAPHTASSLHNNGARTFTRGIWKSVYLSQTTSAAVMHVVPHVFYKGAYPAAPLTDGSHGDFEVDVKIFFSAPRPVAGEVNISTSWSGAGSGRALTLPRGESVTTVKIPVAAASVKLWWPAGMGEQTLYNVTVTFQGDAGKPISATRRIGFRTFALVTGNDTDPAYVQKNKDADGTDTMGMLFRVNGAPIFSRGANMIPMEELEGRLNGAAHRQLVQSAVGGGMNTLRVWGGGIFLPDAWYDACDEFGVLVYHDMQYAQQGHSPTNDSVQTSELSHQIRRLSHHPSIVIWDGCNECHVVIGTPTGIYATFVMTLVVAEDKSRVVWPSCPAPGWTNGVNRLTSLPNGSPLGLLPRLTPPPGEHGFEAAALGLAGMGEMRAMEEAHARLQPRTVESATCVFQENTDYDHGTVWTHPTAKDQVCAGGLGSLCACCVWWD